MRTALLLVVLVPLYIGSVLMRSKIMRTALRRRTRAMFKVVIRGGKARGLTRIKESSHG